MTRQPIAHGSFTIERTYEASLARVFAAFTTIEIKQRWFIGPEKWTLIRRDIDFRVGGTEVLHGSFPDGPETLYTARFHHIVNNERIVYVYDMHLSGRHHSVSLSTVEVMPVATGTRVIYTEQIAFLDGTNGTEGTASRQRGVGWHLDNLAGVLNAA
jgi:uncharacterized protein YndB with AHSA1/START domain